MKNYDSLRYSSSSAFRRALDNARKVLGLDKNTFVVTVHSGYTYVWHSVDFLCGEVFLRFGRDWSFDDVCEYVSDVYQLNK